MTTPTPQERAELIVNGLLHRPDDLQGNLRFVERALADATAAAEAEAKQALAHIRKLETSDTENQAAFERVQARVRDLEGEVERLQQYSRSSDDQWSKLHSYFGKDARHAPESDPTMAGMVIAEVERLRGERRVSVQCHCGVTYTPTCPGCGMEIARLADAGGE